jgi:hypothetical protein
MNKMASKTRVNNNNNNYKNSNSKLLSPLPSASSSTTTSPSTPSASSSSSSSTATTTTTTATTTTTTEEKERLFNLWVHDETTWTEDLVVHETVLGSEFGLGEVVEIFHPERREPRLLLQITSFVNKRNFLFFPFLVLSFVFPSFSSRVPVLHVL